jgi:zinc protease
MQPLRLPFEEFRLANGLTVVLHRDTSVPVVAIEVMYHVGSKNEHPGRTGLAHLFEHLMFKGSAHVPDGEHFRRLQAVGAYVNGSTSEDRTNYYEVVPAEHASLPLVLEADRMGHLLPALTQEKLDNQRDVVKNERRQSYDNQPYGRASETIAASLFPPDHPYSWPVIGSMSDLSAATLDDVRDFFGRYYAPNNACLVVAGNFDDGIMRRTIDEHFGPIPAGPAVAVPRPARPSLESDTVLQLPDNVHLPRLYLAWHSAPWHTREDAVLDVLTDVLSAGKNSRLFRALVLEQQIAQSVIAYQHGLECGGKLMIQITARPGHTTQELFDSARREIERILADGPDETEIRKSMNAKESDFFHGLAGMLRRADSLATYATLTGSAANLLHALERFHGITALQVGHTARNVLTCPSVRLDVISRSAGPEP